MTQYDAVGQVTTARKYFPDGMRMPWAQFQYDFDTAGNRKTAACTDKDADSQQEYSLNDVNQYTERTVPGKVIAAGTADSSAVVTVGDGTNNAALANRHGEYFWHVVDADNSGGVFSTTNLQVRAFVQTATNSPVRAEVREALLPQTAESFTFDADGNQTSCSIWTNLWSAENRLIQVESRSDVPDAQKVCVDFVYDHQGRMTTRTLRSGYSGGAYGTTNVTTYVWDGFNILAEISDTGETNLNLWALDLSGTLQGAGGVGGLIAVTTEDGETFLPNYDGNGNICQYVDEDGTVVADREHGPFGRTIALTGDKKDDFTHWFSTKPLDPDTGLVLYELRLYDADLGRFTSRDPIGERGGVNLYGFLQNGPQGRVDLLGLDWNPPEAAGLLVAPGNAFQKPQKLFAEYSPAQRQQWFDEFRSRYGASINAAAQVNCVPRKLLAAMIANERLGHTAAEARMEQTAYDLGLLGPETSRGVGQVRVDVALRYNASGYKLSDFDDKIVSIYPLCIVRAQMQLESAVSAELMDPGRNIAVFARLVRRYMDLTCAAASQGKMKEPYLTAVTGRVLDLSYPHNRYREFCCACPVDFVPDRNTLAMMAVVWNNEPGNWDKDIQAERPAAWQFMIEGQGLAGFAGDW